MKTLSEQNQLTAWRDCELAGLRHQLGKPEVVQSVYGSSTWEYPSTVRRCRRCPVGIYTRGR